VAIINTLDFESRDCSAFEKLFDLALKAKDFNTLQKLISERAGNIQDTPCQLAISLLTKMNWEGAASFAGTGRGGHVQEAVTQSYTRSRLFLFSVETCRNLTNPLHSAIPKSETACIWGAGGFK
jgi:hypothetical protein